MKTDARAMVNQIDETPAPDLWRDIESRRPGPPPQEPSHRSRLAAGLVAFVVAAAALTFGYQAFRPAQDDEPRRVTGPTSTPLRDPAVLPYQSLPINGTAGSIAAADGWVWVTSIDLPGPSGTLERIDPETGEVTMAVPVPDSPSFLAAGGGYVWAPISPGSGDPLQLLQIDATSGEIVSRFPGLTGPLVAATNGTLWAIAEDAVDQPEIVQLDAESGHIVSRVGIASSPFDMVEAAGSIWALLPGDDRATANPDLIRIDSETGQVTASLDVQSSGIWLAGSDQGVWLSSHATNQRGNSVIVSASDNSVTAFGNVYNFRPFAVADGHVWFIAGPHDGLIQGTCGLNIETQIVDVCANDGEGPDLPMARDPAAYEPTTNTLWTGVYLKALVTRAEAAGV